MQAPHRMLVPLLWLALACAAGCENNSPAPGDECTTSGGICSKTACGESLPYPCAEGESCCQPPADAGARHD